MALRLVHCMMPRKGIPLFCILQTIDWVAFVWLPSTCPLGWMVKLDVVYALLRLGGVIPLPPLPPILHRLFGHGRIFHSMLVIQDWPPHLLHPNPKTIRHE